MSLRLELRLGRLEHASASASTRRPFKLRLGHLRQLPRDYIGAHHIEIVRRLPPRSPIGEWVEFEERPGPGPKPEPSRERIISVSFIGGGEGAGEDNRQAFVQA